MRRQKTGAAKLCFCEEYRFQQKKLKSLLVEKLPGVPECEQWSTLRLLKTYFETVAAKERHIEAIDTMLRNYIKQQPTIQYLQTDNIRKMVDAMISKIKKQRDVHIAAIKQQRMIVYHYVNKQKRATEQIEYLKQLLKEEQGEVQNWRKEAIKFEDQALEFSSQLKEIRFYNEELKASQREQKEFLQKLENRLASLEKDKAELSKKYFQKSQELTKFKDDFEGMAHQIRYEAKIESLKCIQQFKKQSSNNKQLNKNESSEEQAPVKIQSQRANVKDTQQPSYLNSGNRSLSFEKNPIIKKVSLDKSALNRSLSTKIAENTELIWIEKNNSVELSKDDLFSHLFVGDILFNQDSYRYFLVEALQRNQKNLITRTRLLYRWDHLNNVNIHRYIDTHANVVFLFRTENDQYLAAYSKGAFRPKSMSNHLGLLISLNNKIQLKNTKRAIVYDENQIIFGNYDLRYRSGDNKISSNLGSSGSFYQNNGKFVGSLLGEGKNREVKIRYLQVFEAIFQ